MSTPFEAALKRWATAHKVAEENPSLLVSNAWSESNSALCAKRMEEVSLSEALLFKYDDPRLKPFREAKADPGCGGCWFSSNPNPKKKHPACNEKIARWFSERDKLIELGLKL